MLDYKLLENDLKGYLYAILKEDDKLYRTYSLYEAVKKYNDEGKKFYIYTWSSISKRQRYILTFWK